MLEPLPILEESADKSNLAQYSAIMRQKMAIPSLWEKMSKILFALPIVFALASCARDTSGDLGDAMTFTPEETKVLDRLLNGTMDENAGGASGVASTNSQTTLLIAILCVLILIALLVAFKVFKKK